MYLKKLNHEDFKCFEDMEIEFDKHLTLIVGTKDAAGIAVSALFSSFDKLNAVLNATTKCYQRILEEDVKIQYSLATKELYAIYKDN